jgi:phenylpropionate dioxygenase-like ring-hydroxylating dioxygenase large terminal subunit
MEGDHMINTNAILDSLSGSRELLAKGLADRRLYSDPDIYRLEQERIFARSWIVVGHESQIPAPGDFVESFMGEESVIVTRDLEGQVHVLLNTCRHRGNKVCRAEVGNTNTFLCQYHGWTYDIEGKFVGAPFFESVYQNDIDPAEWGLKAAHVAIYKELIFASFAERPTALEDYLGDFAWVLDIMLEPRPGGIEVLGTMRWMANMNWKFGAENSGGDTYHSTTTHASARGVGHKGVTTDAQYHAKHDPNAGFTMVTPQGHVVNAGWVDPIKKVSKPDNPLLQYFADHLEEKIAHLGEPRGSGIHRYNANVFPNAGFHTSAQSIHLLHPRGPNRTEIWMLLLVDKAAPEEVKRFVRREADHHFGPAGIFEEDDGENWEQATASCDGPVASTIPFNLQMGFGRETTFRRPGTPELLEGNPDEYGQRRFLEAWFNQMLGDD